MYLGPTKKACQISDEQLIRCMKDYLEYPARYHPEYLKALMNDYQRRIETKTEGPLVKLDINEVIKKMKGEQKDHDPRRHTILKR